MFHVRRLPYAYKNPNWTAIYNLVCGPNRRSWLMLPRAKLLVSKKTQIYWPCYFLTNLHDQKCVQYIHNTERKIHSFGVLCTRKTWRTVSLNRMGEKIYTLNNMLRPFSFTCYTNAKVLPAFNMQHHSLLCTSAICRVAKETIIVNNKE
jgi:hypothetical protein